MKWRTFSRMPQWVRLSEWLGRICDNAGTIGDHLVGLAKFNSPFSGHDRGMGDKSRNQGARQVCCLGAVRVMALAYIAIAVRAKKMAARPILAMARSSQRMLKPAAHSTA